MKPKIVDVLVVGAGPTGTTLAIDLARRGLDIRIVDKAPGAFVGSRAKGVQPRTSEVLQDLGALDAVLEGGCDYPPLGIHIGPLVIPFRMMARGRRTSDVPFPNTWLIPQFRTDAALHRRLKALGRDIEYGAELVGLEQTDETVVAELVTGAVREEIAARYLVGADGGSSRVRRKLGIGFAGSTHEEDRMLIVDAATTGLSRRRWHIWPGRAGRFVGACPLPQGELFQWMIRLAPDERPDLDPAAVNARVQARICDPRIVLRDFRWTSVFRPNIRLAETYRRGRVFLAGDAAHVHTPAGAQGLNTGIQDAYNLGWKLAQVLAGADERLLETYEDERLPVAASVLKLSTKTYEGIAKLDPSSIRRGTDEKQLALSYRNGPLAPGGTQRTARLRIGDRAPDADLHAVGGQGTRLFDVLAGPHFTAIAYGDAAGRALEAIDWPAAGASLKRILIDVGQARSGGDRFTDRAGSFGRAYGVTGDTLLLIRPDGYIGHIATRDMVETIRPAILAMTPPWAPTSSGAPTID